MTNTNTLGTKPLAPKIYYPILDGLRGVAAVMVLIFHLFELLPQSEVPIQHGYLAVDFFFLLSGFVIAHAYDDRWKNLTIKGFFKRRLVRLHPMIIFGMAFGAILYYFSASEAAYPNIASTPVWKVIGIMVLSWFLIPSRPGSMEIRGYGEMFPLNGPAWTLFFEYIANILYAVLFRKFSDKVLIVAVVITGSALMYFAIDNGAIVGGWQFTLPEVKNGFIRLLYPFLMGMLLNRFFKPIKFNNSFFWCSVMLFILMAMPLINGESQSWMNGLYEGCVIIFLFPIIIFLGASGTLKSNFAKKTCNFLGEISYPLYITHYPIMYIYFSWLVQNDISIEQSYPYAIVLFFVCIAVAYIALRFYDIPVRKKLSKLFLARK